MKKILSYKNAVAKLSTGDYYIDYDTMPYNRPSGNIRLIPNNPSFDDNNMILRYDTFCKLRDNNIIRISKVIFTYSSDKYLKL